jgi:hypothetical protein
MKLEEKRKKRTNNILDVIGIGKTVKMNLVGLDGNAFSLMGTFSEKARSQGWNREEIDYVINKCTSGDYNNLLCVLMEYCDMDSESVSIDREEDDLPEVVYVNGVTYRKI